jgi:arylsulfatase A-like enzyme
MRGHPLQPLIAEASGSRTGWREEIFAQISEDHVGRTVRNHRWKYAVWDPNGNGTQDAGSSVYTERYLYDLEADPYERNNLVAARELEDVRSELGSTLRRYIREIEGIEVKIKKKAGNDSRS